MFLLTIGSVYLRSYLLREVSIFHFGSDAILQSESIAINEMGTLMGNIDYYRRYGEGVSLSIIIGYYGEINAENDRYPDRNGITV